MEKLQRTMHGKTAQNNGSFTAAPSRMFDQQQILQPGMVGSTLQKILGSMKKGHMITCSEGDMPQYYDVLKLIGSYIVANKEVYKGMDVAVITLDKSRLNTINSLLGREKGGDQSLEAAITCVMAAAKATFEDMLPNGDNPFVIRYSPHSDELTIVAVGKGITEKTIERFKDNLDKAVERIDLSDLKWEEENGSNGTVITDLGRASRIFRYPDIVARSTVNGYALFKVDESLNDKDFLIKGVDEADRTKLHFLDRLPPAYNGVMPFSEIVSPFPMIVNGGRLPRGTMVEVKLERNTTPEEWQREVELLMRYVVRDFNDNGVSTKGAKKCLYELRAGETGDLGRRWFNMTAGNTGCNGMFIDPILRGAYALAQAHGIIVAPTDDLNFLYFGVELDANLISEIRRYVQTMLPNEYFRPRIKAMRTDGLTTEQVRAEFELMDLGMRGKVTQKDLERANLLIQLIENASPEVKAEIFKGMGMYYHHNLFRAEQMFHTERTIRNMQDFTFTALARGQEELVTWMWNLAKRFAEPVKNRLRALYIPASRN